MVPTIASHTAPVLNVHQGKGWSEKRTIFPLTSLTTPGASPG